MLQGGEPSPLRYVLDGTGRHHAAALVEDIHFVCTIIHRWRRKRVPPALPAKVEAWQTTTDHADKNQLTQMQCGYKKQKSFTAHSAPPQHLPSLTDCSNSKGVSLNYKTFRMPSSVALNRGYNYEMGLDSFARDAGPNRTRPTHIDERGANSPDPYTRTRAKKKKRQVENCSHTPI